MRNSGFLWFIIGILILLDIYIFQVIKVVTPATSKFRTGIFVTYWAVSIITVLTLIAIPYLDFSTWPKSLRMYLFALVVAVFFSKLLASMFFAIDDIRRGASWVITRVFSNPSVPVAEGSGITRSAFLSWLGLGVGATLFGSL